MNLKIGAPEFGPNWVRCRLVKLEHPAEDGATHIALWEPRDRLTATPRRGSPRRGFLPFRDVCGPVAAVGACPSAA